MYDRDEDALFGHDGRHKPSPFPQLLTARGWGNSHGRLAYSQMNRQQDDNMSEYAVKTIGMLPKGYIIVNDDTVGYDSETAIRVGHHRVAIPVKDFARSRRLTICEQWELLNPRYIGTYFRSDFDSCRSKRPDFDEAYQEAITNGTDAQFIAQFWTPAREHEAAIDRLRRRLDGLEDQRMELKTRVSHCQGKVRQIKSDIAYQRFHLYDNIQKSLLMAEADLENANHDYYTMLEKIDKIERFLKNYTIL